MSSVIDMMDEVDEIPEGHCVMKVMDKTGDTKHIWNPANEAETEAARATFDSLKAKGYTGYRVDRNGEKGEVMRHFQADAGKVIMAPRTVGG